MSLSKPKSLMAGLEVLVRTGGVEALFHVKLLSPKLCGLRVLDESKGKLESNLFSRFKGKILTPEEARRAVLGRGVKRARSLTPVLGKSSSVKMARRVDDHK
jgi:hypothetical protein